MSLLLLFQKLTQMMKSKFVCFWLLKIIIIINTSLIQEQKFYSDSSMAQLSLVYLNIYLEFTETEGGHSFLLRNFIFYFEVFQKYSNSTVQFSQFYFLSFDGSFYQLKSYIPILTGNISLRSILLSVLASPQTRAPRAVS